MQSHVPEHAELAWLLECTASFGELRRMTQFKDKSDRHEFVSAGLFTYPALMAADILLYDTDQVPVGDDQRQHLELTRDIADPVQHPLRRRRSSSPRRVIPHRRRPGHGPAGARRAKMSKSVDSPQGTILVLDDPKAIASKIKRAVTDTDGEVRFDVAAKPGVSNLLSILAACTGRDARRRSPASYTQYGAAQGGHRRRPSSSSCARSRRRYDELSDDPVAPDRAPRRGSLPPDVIAAGTLRRAEAAIGFLPRP